MHHQPHLQLRGNSVAFNQLVKNGNFVNTDNWSAGGTFTVSNNVATFTADTANGSLTQNLGIKTVSTHKYLVKFDIQLTSATDKIVCIIGYESAVNIPISATTTKQHYEQIITPNAQNNQFRIYFRDTRTSDWDAIQISNANIIDLTLLGKEYTSVLAFNRDYPLPYYSYNAGALLDCNSQALETTGFNQFDGEIESGYIDATGNQNNNNRARSKNFIDVIAGQKYTFEEHSTLTYTYFWLGEYDGSYNLINQDTYSATVDRTRTITLKNNTRYVRFYYSYSSDVSSILSQITVCVYLYWDGSRTGYEPYVKHTYQLPTLDTPLRSAGSVCDTLDADGKLTRNVGSYTFTGNETWSAFGTAFSTPITNLKQTGNSGILGNIICDSLSVVKQDNIPGIDRTIAVRSNANQVIVYISSITSGSAMASEMAGKTIHFELATPTTEQTDKTFTENIIVDDFGTMRFVPVGTESASNPIVPQGNQFFYPADYVLLVDDLNTYVDGAVSNLALKIDLPYKELSSSYIGAITSSQIVAGEFYKNNIAITGGLTNAKYVIAVMSNGNKYPMIITSSLLVTYSVTSWQASNLTVTKIYYKE